MAAKNKFVTDSGLDYYEKKWNKNAHIEISLPADDLPSGFGRSITPRAFRKMVGDKLIKLKTEFSKTGVEQTEEQLRLFLNSQKCAVEFGKESILRVLSQKDCVGLRFTFCLNDTGEESIIVSGLIEENNKTYIVNREAYKTENSSQSSYFNSFDDEKGVGKSYGDFMAETGISLDELMRGNEDEVSNKFTDGVFGLL